MSRLDRDELSSLEAATIAAIQDRCRDVAALAWWAPRGWAIPRAAAAPGEAAELRDLRALACGVTLERSRIAAVLRARARAPVGLLSARLELEALAADLERAEIAGLEQEGGERIPT